MKIENIWKDFRFVISDLFINNRIIEKAIISFYNKNLLNLDEDCFIIIQFKVKLDNSEIRSISYIQTVQIKELNLLIEIFQEFWNIRSEEYHILIVEEIIFTYKIMLFNNDYISKSKISRHVKILTDKKSNIKFKGFNLPNTMDVTE
jgi:hypothetical protein